MVKVLDLITHVFRAKFYLIRKEARTLFIFMYIVLHIITTLVTVERSMTRYI